MSQQKTHFQRQASKSMLSGQSWLIQKGSDSFCLFRMTRFQIYMSRVYTHFKIHSVDLTGVRRRVPRFLSWRQKRDNFWHYIFHPLSHKSNYPPNTKYRTQGNFPTPDDQPRIAQVTENLTND